jgi:hypothetical protein
LVFILDWKKKDFKKERENNEQGATEKKPPQKQDLLCGCTNSAIADKPFSMLRKTKLLPSSASAKNSAAAPSFQSIKIRGGLFGAKECFFSFSSLE